MNNPKLFLLVFLTIVSCGNKAELKIDKSELIDKTFVIFSDSEKDTLTIAFNDSTYQIFETSQKNIPWRISNYNTTDFLILANNVIGIEKIANGNYSCTYIAESENHFQMKQRKPKWEKELIYGTWIEEKYFGTDSINAPPSPNGLENWNWPPHYNISRTKIKLDFYEKFESKIEMNDTGEYILMDLKNSLGLGVREKLWQIKYLSDSLMVVDKKTDNILLSHGEKRLTNIRLKKKR